MPDRSFAISLSKCTQHAQTSLRSWMHLWGYKHLQDNWCLKQWDNYCEELSHHTQVVCLTGPPQGIAPWTTDQVSASHAATQLAQDISRHRHRRRESQQPIGQDLEGDSRSGCFVTNCDSISRRHIMKPFLFVLVLAGWNTWSGPLDHSQERSSWVTRLAAANQSIRATVGKFRNEPGCWLGYARDVAGDLSNSL